MATDAKTIKRDRRRKRIRARISGTAKKPRVSVYRSNQAIVVQAIDDAAGVTVAASSSRNFKNMPLTKSAIEIGKDLAKKLAAQKITHAVFDRGGYIYTGNIAKVADGIREGGISM